MKILGIDFGERKTGLAVAEGFLAEPLQVIETANCEFVIADICRKEKVEKIIVGISEGKTAKKQREFGRKLAGITSLPVEFQDETLTSKEAVAKMKEIGRRVKREDAVSAALILQAYLDSKNV